MTDDRKRAEDVYELVERFDDRLGQVEVTQYRIETTVDVLADHVIGPRIPDPLSPDEWLINGRGEPMRKPKPRWPRWVGQVVIQTVTLVTALVILITALQ